MKCIWLLLIILLLLTSCSYNQKSFTKNFVNSLNEENSLNFQSYFSEDQLNDFDTVKNLLFGFNTYNVIQFSSSEDQKLLINSKFYDVKLILFLEQNNTFVIVDSDFNCTRKDCQITRMKIDKSSMIKLLNQDYFSETKMALNFADYLEMPLTCYEGECNPLIKINNSLPNLSFVKPVIYCNWERQQTSMVQVQEKDACEDFKYVKKAYDAYCLGGPKNKVKISFKGKFNNCETGLMNVNLNLKDKTINYTRYYFEK